MYGLHLLMEKEKRILNTVECECLMILASLLTNVAGKNKNDVCGYNDVDDGFSASGERRRATGAANQVNKGIL